MSQNGAQGSAVCLGALAKMSGIDCRRFLRSPHPLPLLLIFRTLVQFGVLRVRFWKRLLSRLRTSSRLATMVSRALQPQDGRIPCPMNRNKVMLCYVMLCYVMLCYVMLCYVMFNK